MHPAAHAALGFVLYGPIGAVASVAPDIPIGIAYVATNRNRRWLPRNHPLITAQRYSHSLCSVVSVGFLAYGFGTRSLAWPICWLLHILIDQLTHTKDKRWPLI